MRAMRTSKRLLAATSLTVTIIGGALGATAGSANALPPGSNSYCNDVWWSAFNAWGRVVVTDDPDVRAQHLRHYRDLEDLHRAGGCGSLGLPEPA